MAVAFATALVAALAAALATALTVALAVMIADRRVRLVTQVIIARIVYAIAKL